MEINRGWQPQRALGSSRVPFAVTSLSPETIHDDFLSRLAGSAPTMTGPVIRYAAPPSGLLEALTRVAKRPDATASRKVTVPHSYLLHLSLADFGWHAPHLTALARELALALSRHIALTGGLPTGATVEVEIVARADFEPGLFQADTLIRSGRGRT